MQGELYLEAQPDWEQLDELEATQTITPKPVCRRTAGRRRAGPDVGRVDWALVEAELIGRRACRCRSRVRGPRSRQVTTAAAPAGQGGRPPVTAPRLRSAGSTDR